MPAHGFLRAAVASPDLKLGDPQANAAFMQDLLHPAAARGAQLVVFPELGLTGYTCHDLYHHPVLLEAAAAALRQLADEAASYFSGVAVVGLPLRLDGLVFNCAAVFQAGRVRGFVPKTYLPNYKEFYDARYFASARQARSREVAWSGELVPFGTDLLFTIPDAEDFCLAVEICEDLWVPVPPSSHHAAAGATVIANLSASNETVGKASYRKQLVLSQSGRGICAYLYASSGPAESSTDVVFGGHCLAAENGSLLAESPRFQPGGHLTLVDIDLERLQRDRTLTTSFHERVEVPQRDYRRIKLRPLPNVPKSAQTPLLRSVEPHPFVPSDPATLRERCEEIFATQVTGLARRLDHVGRPAVSIGVSGGLDSTLALLVLCKTLDRLGEPRGKIQALTMPGYGTSARTRKNAHVLMKSLGTTWREIDIRAQCLEQMRGLGHTPFGIALAGHNVESFAEALQQIPPDQRHDLVFENIQARTRTSLLMNSGFVIGTGDLSELALGWTTYNADHMSMYNPNISIPKTLVKFLVRWAAEHEFRGEVQQALLDVVATEISPELLPTAADGTSGQSTESSIGPYELHDFFLYHFLRWGCSPRKLLFLAAQSPFDRDYTPNEIRHWLRVFLTRFFANQFKRSCSPDGPKVGSVSLSPRGDWRMPSDAVVQAWLSDLDSIPPVVSNSS